MAALDDRAIVGEGTTEAEWNEWSVLQRLPRTSVEELVPAGHRAVIVAPHPDDETLSVGGLMAQLARAGVAVQVIAATDGTASHRGSRDWSVERLARERPRECREALHCLGLDSDVIRLGFIDGELQGAQARLAETLAGLLKHSDVVFTTWRHDGHPDHDATGEACAFAAARAGAKLVEVPVWAWHWARPGDERMPWRRARRLPLDADAVARKQRAVQAFESQLQSDASTGAGPVLRGTTVERAARPFEVLFT